MDYRTATREERAAEFINFATKLHDSRYDYAHVPTRLRQRRYQGHHHLPRPRALRANPARAPPSPRNALGPAARQGCRSCKGFRNANQELRTQRFIQRATDRHGDKYDYAKVVFIDQRLTSR